MFGLTRFVRRIDRFGADLRRWPIKDQAWALAFLKESPEARRLLSEALRIETALEAEAIHRENQLWSPVKSQAALARLRSAVATRITSPAVSPAVPTGFPARAFAPTCWPSLNALGSLRFAVASGVAVLAGLSLGWAQSVNAGPVDLVGILQTAAFRGLTW
jgi:hypothetical protein